MNLTSYEKFLVRVALLAVIISGVMIIGILFIDIKKAHQNSTETVRINSGDHTLEPYMKYMGERECDCRKKQSP